MSAPPLVTIDKLDHFYGAGGLRRQVLYDVSLEIGPGEIVILTGPSGSGKTTLLTLIGGLRSAQAGSLKVLGHELKGASEADLVRVRRRIGYIFQQHNLLPALTARQNVLMSLRLQPQLTARECESRCVDALEAVGLGAHVDRHPDRMSGGQKQRVAIARALVGRPQMLLADEPTASLDKQSGRDVVQLMHDLAKQHGCSVVLVTHDNRILDVADRIVSLEDGRLTSFADAVTSSTAQLFAMLAQTTRKGDLLRRLMGLPPPQFMQLLREITAEFEQLLQVMALGNQHAFEAMLDQLLEACTLKVGEVMHADRVSLFVIDAPRQELWSKVAQGDGSAPVEIRIPLRTGIAGHVATTGRPLNVPDAYAEPLFNRQIDEETGYRTRTVLCQPIVDHAGEVFAVAQVLNKLTGGPFDAGDERRFADLAGSIGVILESWVEMTRSVGFGVSGGAGGRSAGVRRTWSRNARQPSRHHVQPCGISRSGRRIRNRHRAWVRNTW